MSSSATLSRAAPVAGLEESPAPFATRPPTTKFLTGCGRYDLSAVQGRDEERAFPIAYHILIIKSMRYKGAGLAKPKEAWRGSGFFRN
jgi:hypothetical protein